MISSVVLPRLRWIGSPPKLWPRCVSISPISSSSTRCSALEPPDVPRLADAARISLSPQEVEEFAPKIRQVIDWFGQLQAVNLESVEPSLRASTEAADCSREDIPETFDNKEALIEALPSYDDPYIKVPRVLNKE
ncbi:glutamyl-tRNA(Gln) amidotransferase subunit C, chloroplastic/mitochondrial isoform X1 [Typha latifolia]|uniref:glutamyl-tRNA(Gln) amidotransferase subunit C, chloroplastic/mitochondrial isoform X1 n=1 Tax=Typha latifolia TaxID=4733 RepID=UPI003C2CB071